jgi:hypothetical protein
MRQSQPDVSWYQDAYGDQDVSQLDQAFDNLKTWYILTDLIPFSPNCSACSKVAQACSSLFQSDSSDTCLSHKSSVLNHSGTPSIEFSVVNISD